MPAGTRGWGNIPSGHIACEIQKVLLGLKPLSRGPGEFGQLAQRGARDRTLMPMMQMKNLIFFFFMSEKELF